MIGLGRKGAARCPPGWRSQVWFGAPGLLTSGKGSNRTWDWDG